MVANDESDGRHVGNCSAVDLKIVKFASMKSLVSLVSIWWTGGYELTMVRQLFD